MSDTPTNRERYNDLRKGISALFTQIASDIQNAAAHYEAEPIAEKLERLKKRYGAAIADIGAREKANDSVIDKLVSEWSGAQGLIIMPELLDDTDPDIDNDVSDMLISAEAALEGLADGHLTPELREAEFDALKELYGFDETQCEMLTRLNAAEEVLEIYQEALEI